MRIADKIHDALQLDEGGAEHILQAFGWRWFWFGFGSATVAWCIVFTIYQLN